MRYASLLCYFIFIFDRLELIPYDILIDAYDKICGLKENVLSNYFLRVKKGTLILVVILLKHLIRQVVIGYQITV